MRSDWLKRFLLATVFALVSAGSVLAQSTTVVLVRHAEKADDSADPALSDAGNARARALADALAHAGITHIFTTQFQRTRMTAAPLAEKIGVASTVVAASGGNHAADVAAHVRQHAAGGTVLVVGHSNTVPAIIRALGGPDVGQIEDAEYGNLFVLTLTDGGAKLIRSSYGGH